MVKLDEFAIHDGYLMRGQECGLLVLARPHLFNHFFQRFFLTTLTSLDTMQRRSTRVPIPKRHFEDVSAILPPKKRQKSAQIDSQPLVQKEARADASVLVITQPTSLEEPTTPPPMPVEFENFKIHWKEREPIELFIRFFDPQSLFVIT